MRLPIAFALALSLAGCRGESEPPPVPSQPAQPVPPPPIPAPAPIPAPVPAAHWRALGTEPFWNVDLSGATARHATPDDLDGTAFPVNREPLADGGERVAGVLRGEPLRLEITRAACSDGMSDRRYDWTARMVIGQHEFQGCAIRRGDCGGSACDATKPDKD